MSYDLGCHSVVLNTQMRYRILGIGREREGSKEGNEMGVYGAPPICCTSPICYFFKSPQQSSEAPLRYFAIEVTEDHRS